MNKHGVLLIINLLGYLHSCTHISSDISLYDSGLHYKSSTLVDFVYPVIPLHVWLSSGSSGCACLDLDHTGVSYLAAEWHKANAVCSPFGVC